jgi:hypothetical protein
MNPLFEKIEVKTIDDLPKEDISTIYGKYKNSVTIEAIEFHKNDLQWGIANIDWYFKPVSEEEVQNELCIYPRIKRNV